LPSGSGGSQKVLSQNSKVKFYFSTVRSRVIPILKRIEVGDYPSKIARIYGWSKQHVFYYLRKQENETQNKAGRQHFTRFPLKQN
jgi:hypothetical protein